MSKRILLLIFALSLALAGADAPILWQDPADIASRDLVYGSGGKDNQPVGPFTFVEEDKSGTNPKFDVRDAQGIKWKVKLGEETGPETAAARLVWALGYPTSEYYFLPSITVDSLPPKLDRGDKWRLGGGSFANVRLKKIPKDFKRQGEWKWKDNPFAGSREFNGLRTLMAVINNWDLKDENNAILITGDGKTLYTVSDLGATFGTDHLVRSHEVAKGNLESYRKSKFMVKTTPQTVDFGTPGKPSVAFIFVPNDSLGRVGMEWIGKDIPRQDARWMGELAGRLTPVQIRDAFRTSGYTSDQVEGFAQIVEKRIAELKAL